MKQRRRTTGLKRSTAAEANAVGNGGTEAGTSSAFDVWLERGLHKLFDDVAAEPIPPELLQLIEGHRPQHDDEDPTGGSEE